MSYAEVLRAKGKIGKRGKKRRQNAKQLGRKKRNKCMFFVPVPTRVKQ